MQGRIRRPLSGLVSGGSISRSEIQRSRLLFAERAGDISEYINRFGYDVYARQNVEIYRLMLQEGTGGTVVALSSGFMTYSPDIHPDYRRLRRDLEQSPSTFVLIPSLDRELCVAETVRRQLSRPFARSRMAEEAVIRARFPLYVGLPPQKIETMKSVFLIADEICELMPRSQRVIDRRS